MIRVGVVGAAGRMGREVCRAVASDPDLGLVAAVDPSHAGQVVEGCTIAGSLDALTEAGAEVVVEFTRPEVAPANIAWCIGHGLHVVSGTTGFEPDPAWGEQRDVGVFIAANFAIGAVLMMRFAEEAARFLPDVEIVELHHGDKPDAPSGTSMTTARRLAAAAGHGRAGGSSGLRARRRCEGRRRRRGPRPLGPPARARRPSGGDPRRARSDALDPPRLHVARLVHARRADGGEGGPFSARPHGRPRRALGRRSRLTWVVVW